MEQIITSEKAEYIY